MTAACLAYLIQFAATHPASDLRAPTEVYAMAFGMAVFSTVLPAWLLSLGIPRIGASRASLVSSLGPVATIGMAYVFLGEVMTAEQLVGSLLVVARVLVVSMGKGGAGKDDKTSVSLASTRLNSAHGIGLAPKDGISAKADARDASKLRNICRQDCGRLSRSGGHQLVVSVDASTLIL